MSDHPVVACYRGLDSADAVQLGAMLAGALRRPLVLAAAYHYEPVGLSSRAVPAGDNARRAGAAEHALRRARGFVPGEVEVRERVVPVTDVARGLVDLAHEVDASLLVLGRDTEGRVTRSLVPRSPCPVAVAPLSVPLPAPGAIARIGVAYDGSSQAQGALDAATQLAAATGARLVLLTAAPTRERAQTWLQVARVVLDHDVQSFEARALVGETAVTLARAGAELDLLVCGSRGRTRPLSAILGSVSEHLVMHAECPVVVVPPAACESAERRERLVS